jgi:acetylornithine deacetylase/succinyl-diaminopimelate desuccinylase-like protein
MTSPTADVLAHLQANRPLALERLFEFLRIPSVGTDPEHDGDTRRAAEMIAADLNTFGMNAEVRTTPGHPMVVAHDPGPGTGPTILYYGHYDVQPPDPIELWDAPPFEPTLVGEGDDERVVARGAVDDKGQLMTFIEAMRAWKAVHGSLPITVKILLEGEEESGSPSLEPFLKENAEELAADICVVCDTGMWDKKTPAITYMLRGLLYVQITVKGPSHDLHSGMYGGGVVNPNNALAQMIAALHDDEGRVTIPGFYDDVAELSDEERTAWEGLGFDDAAFLATAGLVDGHGEQGYSLLERTWSRPTLDVNGMWGGYTGDGAKTVIPSESHAKISCRLVPNQDPEKILAALTSHLTALAPKGCEVIVDAMDGSPAHRVNTDSPFLGAMIAGLEEVFPNKAQLIGTGGSIPLVGSMHDILGLDALLVGFALDDDRMHSPNEKFNTCCFYNGMNAQAAIIGQLAQLGGTE